MKNSHDKNLNSSLHLTKITLHIDAKLYQDFANLSIVKELVVPTLMRRALKKYANKQKRKLLQQVAKDLDY